MHRRLHTFSSFFTFPTMPKRKRGRPKANKEAQGAGEAKEANEEEKEQTKDDGIDWEKHPAKFFLRDGFYNGAIPMKYMTKEGGPGPRAIWEEHCKDSPLFRGMEYNSNFTSRLRTVRNDCEKKFARAEDDQKAYDNFRSLYPRPTHDHKGIPLWDGSDAQRLLKQLMAEGKHVGVEPKNLWENEDKELRKAFQVYTLDVFRKHIYQEKRLWKLHNYLEEEGKKKKAESSEDG
jgi:hypothetical protein